jgi:SAM-dependent methyltransferase
LPWESETFDAVCCLETIEHVLDEHKDLVFQELQRVLRTGGLALFTTPHAEDLTRSQVYCPHCSSEFHRWQHVRNWTASELNECLVQNGFEVLFCQGINLCRFRPDGVPWRQISFGDVERWTKHGMYRLLDRFLPRPFPHGRAFQVQRGGRNRPNLVAVVRKLRQAANAGIEPRRRLHPSQAA